VQGVDDDDMASQSASGFQTPSKANLAGTPKKMTTEGGDTANDEVMTDKI
jgi:hypothetical protein